MNCLYIQALVDVRLTGAGIKYLYCTGCCELLTIILLIDGNGGRLLLLGINLEKLALCFHLKYNRI